MSRALLAVAAMLPTLAAAGFSANPAVQSTLATATPGQRMLSASIGNPAAGNFLVNTDERFRLGYFSSLSLSGEMFDVENYYDRVDNLFKRFDDDDNTLSEWLDLVEDGRTTLSDLSQNSYLVTRGQFNLPLLPLALRLNNEAVVTINSQVYGESRLTLLEGDIALEDGSEVTTNTAAYLKQAGILEMSLGYSQPVWLSGEGELYAGGRLNLMYAALGKQIVGVDDEDLETDDILDSFDTTPAFGIDLGLLWDADFYALGLTAKNLNQPQLKYGRINGDCSSYSSEAKRQNCAVALSHADKVNLAETHVRHRQFTAEGTLFTANRHWSLNSSLDLNPVNTLTAEREQYLTLGGTYYNPNWWGLTGARAGYSKNLTGRGLAYFTTGLTLFGGLELDATFGEFTSVDDFTAPRQFSINLGLNEKF